MPRMFISQSWVGSAEYDEGDSYSGEQGGNRNQKSVGVHIKRSGDQWYANTEAYAEQPTNKNKTKPLSAFDKVCSADKAYERLMTLSDQLDEQLNDEEISFSDWTYARKQIDKKLDNAWQKLCSLRGWDAGEKDDEIFTSMLNDKVKQYRTASEQKTKQALSVSGVFSEAMCGLKDENVFKKLYVWWRGCRGGDRRLLSAFTNQ